MRILQAVVILSGLVGVWQAGAALFQLWGNPAYLERLPLGLAALLFGLAATWPALTRPGPGMQASGCWPRRYLEP